MKKGLLVAAIINLSRCYFIAVDVEKIKKTTFIKISNDSMEEIN